MAVGEWCDHMYVGALKHNSLVEVVLGAPARGGARVARVVRAPELEDRLPVLPLSVGNQQSRANKIVHSSGGSVERQPFGRQGTTRRIEAFVPGDLTKHP